MSPDVRIWLGTILGGAIVAGAGLYDAFVHHAAAFGTTSDFGLIVAGAGLIAGKAIFDQGVQVPTPPKA